MATLASRPPDALKLPREVILITIDVQKGFDQFPERNNPDCESNIATLHAAWRKAGRPLWHVKHNSDDPASVFRPGLPGNAFKTDTAPAPGEPVVTKSTHSAFIGTDLEELLQRAHCETLLLCGIQTNFCVASTARMAGNLGYRTYVVGDGCATFPQRLLDGRVVGAQMAHDLALAELHGEFATVVSTKDVLVALR